MARKTVYIDVKQPVFPFGTELEANEPEPAGNTRFTDAGKLITPRDLRNALPIPTGYSSFFKQELLNLPALPPGTQETFTYKDSLGNNTLVALGADGARFSNDGVSWHVGEVDNFLASTVVGKYTIRYPQAANYIGFVDTRVTTTKPGLSIGNFVGASPSQPTNASNEQDLILLPYAASGEFYEASVVAVPYDEKEVFDPRIRFFNPGLTTIIVGNTYVMSQDREWAYHTAVTGDTVHTVLTGLVNSYASNSANSGLFATLIDDNTVKVWADNNYSSTAMPPVVIYEIPINAPDLGVVATLANDQFPIDITPSARGNLGFVVFTSAAQLTAGNFNLRRMGYYQTGGTFTDVPGVTPTSAGDLSSNDINLLLGKRWYLPLTDEFYALRQFSGTNQAGLTAIIHDTGIPLTNIAYGATGVKALQTINCQMLTTDVVIGRTFILQSKGQLGSYTAIAGDTIDSIIQACSAAYTAAGIYSAGQQYRQIVVGTSPDRLYFQPSPLATATYANTSSVIHTINSFSLKRYFASASKHNSLYGLLLISNTAPANISYTIYCDDQPVPVTSDAGVWTDVNYAFTAVQLNAAVLAGTKLYVRITGKHITVIPRNLGAGTIGNITFKFRAITSVASKLNSHSGPNTQWRSMLVPNNVVNYTLYTKRPDGKLHRLIDVDNSNMQFSQWFSAYDSIYDTIVSVIGNVGDLPIAPTVETFQFNAPIDEVQITHVDLTVSNTVKEFYTPVNRTVEYLQPITNILKPWTSGVVYGGTVLTSFAVDFNAPVDIITLKIFNPWTTTIIKNRLYAYRNGQGAGNYILRMLQDGSSWEQLIPTFANMAQIEGITSARGRMVMWDTANSIYLSSNTNPTDFTPAIKTGANVFKVDSVIGNIVTIKSVSQGFVIYATSSIILATYTGNTNRYTFTVLTDTQGVLGVNSVVAASEGTHYAVIGIGVYRITSKGIQEVSPSLSEYVLSSNLTPRLDFLAGRYLAISLSPQQSPQTITKIEAFAGSIIPGIPMIPGTPDRIVPEVVVPGVIVPAGNIPAVVVPPIVVSGRAVTNTAVYTDIIVPDVIVPDVPAVAGTVLPEQIIPGYTMPAVVIPPVIVPSTPDWQSVIAGTPGVSSPVTWTILVNRVLPYTIKTYNVFWDEYDADPNVYNGGVDFSSDSGSTDPGFTHSSGVTPYVGPNGNWWVTFYKYKAKKINYGIYSYGETIRTPADLIAHYKKHVDDGYHFDANAGIGSIASIQYAGADTKKLTRNAIIKNPIILGYYTNGVPYVQITQVDPLRYKTGSSGYSGNNPEPAPQIALEELAVDDNLRHQLNASRLVLDRLYDAYLMQYLDVNRYTQPVNNVRSGLRLIFSRGLAPSVLGTFFQNVALPNGLQVDLGSRTVVGIGGPSQTKATPDIVVDHTGTVGGTIKGYTLPSITFPPTVIPSVNIPGSAVIPGGVIKGYTIPGYTVTVSQQVTGYTIPGYTIPAGYRAGYIIPGYTIASYTIPGYPDVPAVPDVVIPGGSFIATQGDRSPAFNIFSRSVILDTKLNNWGSADSPLALMYSFSPINQRSYNPVLGVTTSSFDFQNLGSSLGMIDPQGFLHLATEANEDSYVEFGDFGLTGTGTTRFLDAIARFTKETGAILEVWGSRDGETLNRVLRVTAESLNASATAKKVLTGKWFRLRVSGNFNLKSLEISGEKGGLR